MSLFSLIEQSWRGIAGDDHAGLRWPPLIVVGALPYITFLPDSPGSPFSRGWGRSAGLGDVAFQAAAPALLRA